MSKKRRWSDDYVRVGFTCIGKTEDLQKTQCMLCDTVFSNANLKPSKLQEHSDNRYGVANVVSHDEENLRAKRVRFHSRASLASLSFVSVEKPLLMTTYQVTFKVEKSKKHTIGEEIINPGVLEVATTILENEARKKLECLVWQIILFRRELLVWIEILYKLPHRCRGRHIFGIAKDFFPNFPKLARNIFVRLFLQIISHKDPLFGMTSKNGLHVFFCKRWVPFLKSNNVARHFWNQATLRAIFAQSFRDFAQILEILPRLSGILPRFSTNHNFCWCACTPVSYTTELSHI